LLRSYLNIRIILDTKKLGCYHFSKPKTRE
jgi:hypothetical protein